MKSEKKYYALYKSLKEKILSGEYKAYEKLPSKRIMADMDGVEGIVSADNVILDLFVDLQINRTNALVNFVFHLVI